MKKLITALCIFVLPSISFTLNAQEIQDSTLLASHKRLPILNNMRFMQTDLLRDPFIDSYVRFKLGTGEALDLKSYVKNLRGEVIDTLSGDLSYLSGDFELQFVANDWLAFNLAYGGYARLGTNAYTILTSGISYVSGASLGGKIRIFGNEKMLLSGTIEYSSMEVTVYSIYDFVKEVYEDASGEGIPDSITASLMQTKQIPKTFINLNYAYAPTNYLGVLAVVGWGYGKTFQSKYKGNLRAGIAATMDFENFEPLSFPVGILAGVKYNTYSESGENITNLVTAAFKLGYTGHKDFDIGIESTYQLLDYPNRTEKIKAVLTSFKMQYYF